MPSSIIYPEFRQSERSLPPLITEGIELYLRDESKLSANSVLGVYSPKTSEELGLVLGELAKSKTKITVSAARTGLTGGAVPDPDSVIISLERLKGLVSSNNSDEISVRSGTTLNELMDLIREHSPDYFFPVDPTEQSASVGGAVVLNAGGARSLRFGSVRNWVAGIRFFLPDGSEVSARRGEIRADNGCLTISLNQKERTVSLPQIIKPETKNTIGFYSANDVDLVDLIIGSEGALGILSEVTLKLLRKPVQTLSHFQIFSSELNALKCVEYLRSNFKPYSLEFIDSRSIRKVREREKAGTERFLELQSKIPGGAGAALFIELPVEDDDQLIDFSESFFTFLSELGEDPELAISGTDERTLADIKKIRHLVPERMNEIIAERRASHPGLHKIAMDMAVPDSDLFWVYELYQSELEKSGLEFAVFGHAGSNHFHVNILPRNQEELELGKAKYLELAKLIVSRNGAVAAEHGIGRLKKAFLKAQYSDEVLSGFKKIKEFFDPDGRLNSHVLV